MRGDSRAWSARSRWTRPRVHRDLDELTLGRLARGSMRSIRVRRRSACGSSWVGARSSRSHRSDSAESPSARASSFPCSMRGPTRSAARTTAGRSRRTTCGVASPTLDDLHATVRKAAGARPRLHRDVLHPGDRERRAAGRVARGDARRFAPHRRREPCEGRDLDPGDPAGFLRADPGVGTRKINEALLHGPDLMVKTVEQLTGVAIDGYVLTGFAGFQDLVNAVGGIRRRRPLRHARPVLERELPGRDRHDAGTRCPRVLRHRHDVPGRRLRPLDEPRTAAGPPRSASSKLDVARNPGASLTWVAAGAQVLHTDLGSGRHHRAPPVHDVTRSRTRREPGRLREPERRSAG